MIIISIILTILGILIGAFYISTLFPLRPKEPGYKYVYVEDNGTVRELYPDEIEYLNTDFLPNDSNRPYIKAKYSALTPDNKLSGFINRRRVPKRIQIITLDKSRTANSGLAPAGQNPA